MIAQEYRGKWRIIRRAEYAGKIEPCSRCGRDPQLYAIDPVGCWIRLVVPEETAFFAVRCACGQTGKFNSTGKVATGAYIDEQRAAALAVRNWNAEQSPQATHLYGQTQT